MAQQIVATIARAAPVARADRAVVRWCAGARFSWDWEPAAHHRAAARSARATGAARAIVATICCAIPGPDAERHLLALISFFHRIDTRFLNGARIAYVFHDCHYRPAQCR